MSTVSEEDIEKIKKWYEHAMGPAGTPSHRIFSNESYHKSFWENASHGIVIMNANYEIIDANPYMCDLLNYTRSELTECKLEDICAQRFLTQDYTHIESIIKGRDYSFEKDSQVKIKSEKLKLLSVKIVATRIPSTLTDPFKHLIVHIYPQANTYIKMVSFNENDTEEESIKKETNNDFMGITKSIIQSKWFGWGVMTIILLTALSGELGNLVREVISTLKG